MRGGQQGGEGETWIGPRESSPGQEAGGPWGGGGPSASLSCLPWGAEGLGQPGMRKLFLPRSGSLA